MSAKKKSKAGDRTFLLALAYIAMGILFCIKQGAVLQWVMWVAGILFILQGIYDLIKRNTLPGILEIVAGLTILAFGAWLLDIATLVLGVVILVYSIANLFRVPQNLFTILVNLLSALVGVLLIVNHWTLYNWFFIVLGVALIINGFLTIFKK